MTTDSAVDASGSRLATKTSTALFGWTLPDLHGDVAGAVISSGSAISDAFRYDAYGETIDKATSTLPTPWRYQGRLLENETGDADLYDFGFRSYVADLGAFNSLDDQPGLAQNPISLNRFLYANANPATLIDPDGHCTYVDGVCAGASRVAIAKANVGHHRRTLAQVKASPGYQRYQRRVESRYEGQMRFRRGPTAASVAKWEDDQRESRSHGAASAARPGPDKSHDGPIAALTGVARGTWNFGVGVVTTPIYAVTHLSEAAMGCSASPSKAASRVRPTISASTTRSRTSGGVPTPSST